MQPLRLWTARPPSIGPTARNASLARQFNRLLLGAGLLLLVLIITQLAAITVNRTISARLVEERIVPMSQLQTIASGYQTAWAIADKVRVGTIDPTGGATALRDLRTRLAQDWREFQAGTPDLAAPFTIERPDADEALATLQKILDAGDRERLDFFLSGAFFGKVDPLLGRIARATTDLRATADGDREMLRLVNLAAELLLIAVTVGAIAGGTLIAHLAETRIVRPLADLARHLQCDGQPDRPDTVPGIDRADEVGAIAQALSTAQEHARLAEVARREQHAAEEALQRREREDAERRHALEQALRNRELADARAMQQRAQLIDSQFGRFDAVLSQLVTALSDASVTLRAMATTLASASTQSRDRADAVAASVAAAAARVEEAGLESRGLLNLVAKVRDSAATTRVHSGDVIAEAIRNRGLAQALSTLVSGIDRALELIQRMAAQTNLLSVNASIEAHRTGAAGHGFSVVAREIKTLAVDSSEAAAEIARQLALINRTAADFLTSAVQVEALASGVDTQADLVETLAGRQEAASHAMAGSINDMRSEMLEISTSASDARAGSEELVVAAGRLRDTADSIAGQIAELHQAFATLRAGLEETAVTRALQSPAPRAA
jgi:methyl-accepting chemotaxis protein